jgi:ferric-dicitrate binding protein FerR (iron transport regulator)
MENLTLLENLLKKYLDGLLTIQERRQFNDLLADDANEQVVKGMIHDHINEFTEENSLITREVDFEKLYGNILSNLDINNQDEHPVSRRTLLKKVLYLSAAAAVLAGVFLIGRISSRPAADDIILSQSSFTEVTSPYGSMSEIKLPDGTSVILNAGSTLKYKNDFNRNNRDIELYGEAYFKVAKNPEIPLVVSAGYIDVIALGTEFNIKAYPEESTIETTLIEGKVEIANSNPVKKVEDEFIDLVPNQKAIFYKGEEEFKIEAINKKTIQPEPVKPFLENILISPKADVEKTVAWTEGRLIFRGESFENLCIDLQRKYDVKFVFIEEALKNYRFTGVLLDETLEQVLNVIKLSAPIDYSVEAKSVYLFAKVSSSEDSKKP